MQDTEILLRFLRYTMGLSAFCWDGTVQVLEEIERKHCFSRQAQPLLTANGLQTIMEHMDASNLYEAEDLLGVHFLAFVFKDNPIWIGPFVEKPWEDSAAEVRLMGAGLPASYLLPYKLYYCSYGLMDQITVTRTVTGAIMALSPDTPPYSRQRFSGTLGHCLPDLYTREALDFDSAVRRYDLENRFLTLIEEGHTEAALETWERLGNIPSVKELSVSGLQGMIANITALRTLIRKAAERGGVHPVIVDAISVAYAQKAYSSHSQDELIRIIPAMIREFSDAVHSAQAKHYSSAIRLVVNYLKLHISQEIDMKQLAALANCAPNYFGRRFKAETGVTVAQYLAQERCRMAANLLIQTDLPVQAISAHVGYFDNNYFVKVFKNCIGEAPTAYRNKFRR